MQSSICTEMLSACVQGMGPMLRRMNTQSLYGFGKTYYPETPGTGCSQGKHHFLEHDSTQAASTGLSLLHVIQ